MNVGVAFGAEMADIGEDGLGVALGATHALMKPA